MHEVFICQGRTPSPQPPGSRETGMDVRSKGRFWVPGGEPGMVVVQPVNRRRGHSEKKEGRTWHLLGGHEQKWKRGDFVQPSWPQVARYPNLRFNLDHTTGPLLIPCKPQLDFPKENELQGNSICCAWMCMTAQHTVIRNKMVTCWALCWAQCNLADQFPAGPKLWCCGADTTNVLICHLNVIEKMYSITKIKLKTACVG